jgi:hypothetical protein
LSIGQVASTELEEKNANGWKKAPRGGNADENAFLACGSVDGGRTSKITCMLFANDAIYARGKSGYCRVAVATLDGSRQKKTRTGT